MDSRRRRLVMSLALAPALPAPSLLRAAEVPGITAAIPLRASGGVPAPEPPLRYGEASPGPVLRLRRGAAARIAFCNGLTVPTSLDLHGLRVAPPLGGIGPAGGTILPGATAEIAVTPPDSGTFWFHPWVLDPSADDTGRGLAGVVLVDEPEPPAVDADLVAVLTDRWPPPEDPRGRGPAESFRIGAGAWPRTEVLRPGARVRLRLVNGSTRQALALTCTGAKPSVVAIDGQPSALFTPRGGSVPLAPGGRCDLVFDMPGAAGSTVSVAVRGAGSAPADVALVLTVEGEAKPARDPIPALPPNPLLPAAIALEAATRATMTLASAPGAGPARRDAWSVNGSSGFDLPRRPLCRAKRGTPVVLSVRNTGAQLAGVRIHGVCLRLLHDLDDGWEPYWRESLLVAPGATHHAAFVPDLPGRWLIESPFFDQAAGGLRSWFEVI